MKSIKFLKKLHSEDKLRLIDPSDEICSDYIRKSENSFKAARLLFEQKLFEESVSMAYYSMYHILTALLFKVGIKCENHTGTIILLKELFDISNTDISFAKKERVDKQYYTDFEIVGKDVQDSIKSAEDFRINILNLIEDLKNEKINSFRERLKNNLES